MCKTLFRTAAFWLALVAAPASAQEQPGEIELADDQPMSARVADMALFEPYIGRFRSGEFANPANDTRFYFTVDYDWYDRGRTIVSYRLEQIFPESGERRIIGDGYYYFDRVHDRIGVFGVFPDGRSGVGTMGRFNRDDHSRTVWIIGTSPNQPPLQVRDRFEIIDENSWRNITHVRPVGSDADWREVSNGIYTRLPDCAEDC